MIATQKEQMVDFTTSLTLPSRQTQKGMPPQAIGVACNLFFLLRTILHTAWWKRPREKTPVVSE